MAGIKSAGKSSAQVSRTLKCIVGFAYELKSEETSAEVESH